MSPGHSLRSSLLRLTGAQVPEGAYDPARNERVLSLAGDHTNEAAALVGLHEAYHATLNASTSYGSAMIACGLLAHAQVPGYASAVDRMIARAVTAHETYATISSLASVSSGVMQAELLDAYPNYHKYLTKVRRVFGTGRSAFLTALVLRSCARAAMQVDIYADVLASLRQGTAPDWIDRLPRPDARFLRLMTPALASEAMAAADVVFKQSEESNPAAAAETLSPEAEHEALSALPHAVLDQMSEAAYEVYARALASSGQPTLAYNGHRTGLAELLAAARALTNGRVRREFHIPDTLEAEIAATQADFRREKIVLRTQKISAVFLDASPHELELADLFMNRQIPRPCVQIVAMPVRKANALYDMQHIDGSLYASDAETITGLRRRWRGPDGSERVEFLATTPEQLRGILASAPDVTPIFIASSAVHWDATWQETWVTGEQSRIEKVLFLLDTDPFYRLDRMAENDHQVFMNRVPSRLEVSGETVTLNVITMWSTYEPRVLFFTPCSQQLHAALVSHAARKGYQVAPDPDLNVNWEFELTQAIGFVALEESVFGMNFWEGS